MAPLVDAVLVDRPAHLFGTRGADRAIVFVEAQAAGLEGQAEIIEQAAHFAFGVVDHALVDTRDGRGRAARAS